MEVVLDGSSNLNGSRAGILFKSLHGDLIEYSLHFNFQAFKNKANYEALIIGLGLA